MHQNKKKLFLKKLFLRSAHQNDLIYIYKLIFNKKLIHSLLFTLQNNGDGEMQQKKKGKSRLPCAAAMFGWRSKQRRLVVT